MKFLTSTEEYSKVRNIHIVDEQGNPLCSSGRRIDPKNRKYLDDFPPKDKVCKHCLKHNTPTVLIPSVSTVKAEGQLLRNHPVPFVLVNPDQMVVGSTKLSPEGSRLLMLQLNPSGVTWYYSDNQQRDKDITKIRKSKL